MTPSGVHDGPRRFEDTEAASEAGSVTSKRKARAARKNGQSGGRPGNPAIKRIMRERGVSRQYAWKIWKDKHK
jgi:hypothetical protein